MIATIAPIAKTVEIARIARTVMGVSTAQGVQAVLGARITRVRKLMEKNNYHFSVVWSLSGCRPRRSRRAGAFFVMITEDKTGCFLCCFYYDYRRSCGEYDAKSRVILSPVSWSFFLHTSRLVYNLVPSPVIKHLVSKSSSSYLPRFPLLTYNCWRKRMRLGGGRRQYGRPSTMCHTYTSTDAPVQRCVRTLCMI